MDDASNIVIYVTDFIFILRLIFHETKTPQGIRALTPELADAVVDAYAKQQKEKVHEEVNNYLSELGDSVQNSPEAVAQFLRQFINKHRLRLSIGRPPLATPARCAHIHIKPVSTAYRLSDCQKSTKMKAPRRSAKMNKLPLRRCAMLNMGRTKMDTLYLDMSVLWPRLPMMVRLILQVCIICTKSLHSR